MPAGRPKIEIDAQQFEGLCSFQCTLAEIAHWFRCSEDTVERWCIRNYGLKFAEAYEKYSAGGKISLRRAQFKLAEKSAAMAIFLGKQYLGQRDSVQYEDRESLERLDAILDAMRTQADEADPKTE